MHYFKFGTPNQFVLVAHHNAWVARRTLLEQHGDLPANIPCQEISRTTAWAIYRDVWAHELEMSNSEVDRIAGITFDHPGVMAHISYGD
ncbi:hypothetical protein D1831_07335 [Lactiplantibacillus garii]|uniref:Uncharacterized protein n=1 Tax=Lactiplantibacillus garii TaxID=2306423 RepID=A0A426D789_9LACO|nr:hypothetical protein [Lactiplantibacillus garii]RRK10469.1 hypothetical protein D1831_07335 [Lactiplantibacillus garii]